MNQPREFVGQARQMVAESRRRLARSSRTLRESARYLSLRDPSSEARSEEPSRPSGT